MSGTKVKLQKSALKDLVRECLLDVIREDPTLVREVLAGAVSSLLEVTSAPARLRASQPVAEHTQHQASRVRRDKPASTRQHIREGKPVRRPTTTREAPGDIFEQLAADTLARTLPQQERQDRSRSLAMLDLDTNIEEGPAARLAEARRQPDVMQHVQRQQTQPVQTIDPIVAGGFDSSMLDSLTPEQLLQLSRQQHAGQAVQVRESRSPVMDVDDQWLDELAEND